MALSSGCDRPATILAAGDPEVPMAKRLIVCCDGTWNEPGAGRDTNVVKLSKAVSPSATDGRSQIVFYDRGVGTGDLLDRVLGGAMGHGLTQTVLDAYRFFAEHYEPDGELYLFGSSCGAYTARSTVGMIRNSGLLRADQLDQGFTPTFAIISGRYNVRVNRPCNRSVIEQHILRKT